MHYGRLFVGMCPYHGPHKSRHKTDPLSLSLSLSLSPLGQLRLSLLLYQLQAHQLYSTQITTASDVTCLYPTFPSLHFI